jgi:hypothetical protein
MEQGGREWLREKLELAFIEETHDWLFFGKHFESVQRRFDESSQLQGCSLPGNNWMRTNSSGVRSGRVAKLDGKDLAVLSGSLLGASPASLLGNHEAQRYQGDQQNQGLSSIFSHSAAFIR